MSERRKSLYKTTIVIWTDYNPAQKEIDDLALQAVSGDAYCSKQEHTFVENVDTDPEWDPACDFFGWDDEDVEVTHASKRTD